MFLNLQLILMIPGALILLLSLQTSAVGSLPPVSRQPDQLSGPPSDDSKGGLSSRDGCPREQSPMMVIAPETYQYGGLTHLEQPTLWIQLPFAMSANDDLEASVQLTIRGIGIDKNNEAEVSQSFETTIPDLNLQHGIVGISLESSSFVLPVNKTFEWSLDIYCDAWDDFPSYSVSGWIARVDGADMTQSITETASVIELSQTYRDNALWYDAVSVLGETSNDAALSNSVRTEWRQLLSAGGFSSATGNLPVQHLTLPAD